VRLDFVEFTGTLTIMVNTELDDSGGIGHLAGADHGGSALEGVGFAAEGGDVGAAHDGDAGGGIPKEYGNDLAERGGGHGEKQTIEDGGVDSVVWIVAEGGRDGRGGNLPGKGCPKSIEREGFGEDAVVALDGGRRRGGHGEEPRAGSGLAETQGKFGSGEARHAKVGEDAAGRFRGIGEEIERLLSTGSLKDVETVGFEENHGDGKADGVVVDGENTVRSRRVTGTHDALDCTQEQRLRGGSRELLFSG
jgi:hypothetical protein